MSHPSHDPIARLLAEHQDFFKLAFERSRGTIVVSRHAPFNVLDINPKAAKTCDVDASAVRGAPLFSAIPALDHHSVRELFELSKDNPQAAVVTINHKPIRVDHHPNENHETVTLRLANDVKKTGKKRTRSQTEHESIDDQQTNGHSDAAVEPATPAAPAAPPTPIVTPNSRIAEARGVFDKIGSGAAVDTNELSAVLPALVVEGVLENVRFALEHGADPNRPTDAAHPFSALYAAVNLGKLEIVQLLLDHGASIVIQNYDQPSETPLKLALKSTPSPIYHSFAFRLSNIDAARKRAIEKLAEEDLRRTLSGDATPYRPPHSRLT